MKNQTNASAIFEIDKLREALQKVASNGDDKISRSTVRKWMILHWVEIMRYLKSTLVKDTTANKKFTKVQYINTLVISVINNFLNYRIISDLGLSNDEVNTQYDQVLIKHIGKIQAMFKEELEYVAELRNELTINIPDSSGFLCILPNVELAPTDPKDIVYNSDLKERRFFLVVKREDSFIQYEKGLTLKELSDKYPDTTQTLHGISNDVDDEDIVVFDGLDEFYRSLPADMSYGMREMQATDDFNIITVMDQTRITGSAINFFEIRKSNEKYYQDAAKKLADSGIYDILDRDIVDGLNEVVTVKNMTNSFVVWDGHPSTFKLSSESNYQLLNLRHIDFDQTITKGIKDSKWTSEFINSLLLISTGDNMFNITASLDRLRDGIAKDQNSLRAAETAYHEIVRKVPTEEIDCIRTDGELNISSKTNKQMRDSRGNVKINSTHTMLKGQVVTKLINRDVAFIKREPEHEHTDSKFDIITEISMPAIEKSYEEEASDQEHSFYISPSHIESAAKRILIENKRTAGPISGISSVINVKDLVAAGFGTAPTLEVMTKDDIDLKLAKDTFTPFTINEVRYHVNSGCVHGEVQDDSFNIKIYGRGKIFQNTVDSILIEMFNKHSLIVHPREFKFTQEFKPKEYHTLTSSINETTVVFETHILRGNHYQVILKLPRSEVHELIYSYSKLKLSTIAAHAYKTVAKMIVESLSYNPYFYIMLGMKYDMDSRFSNEIVASWNNYLDSMKEYSNLEKLILHHIIMDDCKQKLLDCKSTETNAESELIKSKKQLLKEYASKSEYYTQAVKDITQDLDNDENIADRVYGQSKDANNNDFKELLETMKDTNQNLQKNNDALTTDLESVTKQLQDANKVIEAASKSNAKPKKNDNK